jgi:hypothetical protein
MTKSFFRIMVVENVTHTTVLLSAFNLTPNSAINAAIGLG